METLFNCIVKNSTIMRKRVNNADGLSYWKALKIILAPIKDLHSNTFKKIPTKIYNKYMALQEYDNNNMIEHNHFLMQIVRIPTNEQPELIKIMQIAYNIGQYYGYTHNKTHKIECDKDINKMDNIYNFITITNINKMNKIIKNSFNNNNIINELCTQIKQLFEQNITK
jgi:hypothetical protein